MTESTRPPRHTGRAEVIDSLDGMFVLSWGPVGTPSQIEPVQIIGGPLAVPVFSSLENLERFCREFPEMHVCGGRIVTIDDTRMFFEDVPRHIVIALDGYKTPEGRVRYLDVSEMRKAGLA